MIKNKKKNPSITHQEEEEISANPEETESYGHDNIYITW
jgi:hypothetical protein